MSATTQQSGKCPACAKQRDQVSSLLEPMSDPLQDCLVLPRKMIGCQEKPLENGGRPLSENQYVRPNYLSALKLDGTTDVPISERNSVYWSESGE
jgi:hypothetical protein